MKAKSVKKKSLSRKFATLMGIFLVCFISVSTSLLIGLHILNKSYITKRDELRDKQRLAQEINNSFNLAFFEARGYLAFDNPKMRDNTLAQEPIIQSLTKDFQKHALSKDDRGLLKSVRSFTQYYYHNLFPKVINENQAGRKSEVVNMVNSKATSKVIQFQQTMKDYLQKLDSDLGKHFQTLTSIQTNVQIAFVIFILLILLILLRIIRLMIRDIGRPLSKFADAANEIANGNAASITVDGSRGDEIGALSFAFQKMVENVQEKEQDLQARNNELSSFFQKSEEERKLNQDILNTLKEGVQLIDVEGKISQINNPLCQLISCENDSLVGMNWEKWTSYLAEFVDGENFSENITKALAADQPNSKQDSTFVFTLKKSKKVVKVYKEGLFRGDKLFGTILVYRDITKEYEVDQIKSEFVSTVSHELRTPLASILGFTELMLNRDLKPERQVKYLTTILNEAKRLTALINDYLDIQRMEAGKQTYEKKYIELIPILEKIIETQLVNPEQHKIVLKTSITTPIILGDKAKIEQVFTNLINNSIKYSPNGGEIIIQISEMNKKLRVSVTDFGLGIPEESVDKLFTKFYRVDNSDRRRIGGTGLGLAIVQEIVRAHDGEITVDSTYGKGSTFTITFPATLMSEEVNKNMGVNEGSVGHRIVVVEDDQALAELIIQELRNNGFNVIYFKTGKDTLDYLSREIPDAIVLDILLEDVEFDGWKIMREIKENERLKNIPIIVSTALDEKEKGFSLGAMDFLVKPYKPSHLSKAINQTLLKMGKIGQILIPQQKEEE